MADMDLDLTGLLCPLPVLKARKALSGMADGDRLHLIITDPAAAIDIPHFCNESGHKLVTSTQDGAVLTFTLECVK